ncbi:MAG TPA: hypothetical protein PKE47_16945, partial [Verrucomicrobiota bacterium]|nr:hypothetical protein [Verrucomicrobiota bacterium]
GQAGPAARPTAADDEAAVRQVFLDYRAAIDSKSGERAADLASKSTHDYFETMRKSALSMPAAEVRKLPTMDRLMVLAMRNRIDADVLRKLDGRGSLGPGVVVLDGDSARIGLEAGGEKVPPESGFRFERERGSWKIDVMSITPLASPALDQALAQIDPDPDVAIVSLLEKEQGVFVAVSDNMKLVPDQIAPWVPGGLFTLGTDGFGRSETRENLRRFFEVDAESVTIATLYALAEKGELDRKVVTQAIKDLGVDPEKVFPELV